jgi:hypothetical protein
VILIILALLVICIASSSAADRAKAKIWLKPYELAAGIAAIVIWVALLGPAIWAALFPPRH